MKRILVDLFFFVAVFFLPWWFVMFLAIGGLVYFSSFYEVLIVGIVIDSLYNASIPRFHHLQFVVTLLALVLFVVVETAKRRLRFYDAR